jgi:hypothetical protein
MASKNETPADVPAGVSLDWTQPEHPEAPAPEDLKAAEDDKPKGHVDQAAYIAGLELELVLYSFDKERKAAIVAELDRVRGGKAVKQPKETR